MSMGWALARAVVVVKARVTAAGLVMLDRRAAGDEAVAVVLETRERVPRTAGRNARVSEDDIVYGSTYRVDRLVRE
jgi:hypothetical protein